MMILLYRKSVTQQTRIKRPFVRNCDPCMRIIDTAFVYCLTWHSENGTHTVKKHEVERHDKLQKLR